MSNTKNIFFLGKGGAGKSTSAALTSLYLAKKGFNVLLVSMDPAHNQSDIFETKFSEKPVEVIENLKVEEVDSKKWTSRYLKNIKEQLNRTYSYLTAFNLEGYFDILKYSPGIEEYALLLAYKNITEKEKDRDYIVFDMPPTALTLKFLILPDISLKWLENLLKLREKILEKKEIIAKVRLGKKEFVTDKISNKLNKQIEDYEKIKKEFRDKNKTSLNLVMNPDKLSFSESQLIIEELTKFNIEIDNVFINKVNSKTDLTGLKKNFNKYTIQRFPESKEPLTGISALSKFLDGIDSFVNL